MINDIYRNKITGKYYKYGDYDVDSIEDATTVSNCIPKQWYPTYTRMSYKKELRKLKLEKIKNE